MPPVKKLDWNPFEESAVASRFRAAVVGTAEIVRSGLELFLAETKVDELIIATTVYDHAVRLRSYEMVAEIAGKSVEQKAFASLG